MNKHRSHKRRKTLLYSLLPPLCVLFLTLGAMAALASGDVAAEQEESRLTLEDYREQLQTIADRQKEVEAEIERQAALIEGLEADITAIDVQLITVTEQLALTQRQIDLTQLQIAALEELIVELQDSLAQRIDILEQRLVDLYIYGDMSLLDVIFESSSFQDFITLFDLVELLVANDRQLAATIEQERLSIEQSKAEVELALSELQEVKQDHYDMMSSLNRLIEEKSLAIAEANLSKQQYEAIYAAQRAEEEAAKETIRQLLAASTSTLSFGGYLSWPLPAAYGQDSITSPYGWREHPVYGGQRFHAGIDIGAPGGANIYAAGDGEIILREYYGGYGYCVMIDHGDGIVSLYGHMSAFGEFGVGDVVMTGDVIGYVGTTGTSTGNHLHFEVRTNGEYTSPWDYLY